MDTKAAHQAVIFIRARSVGFGDRDSWIAAAQVSYQREVCAAAAERLGARPIREYLDYGGTGSLDKRPELRLMLDELRALRDVRYVIVASPDRLARKTADWDAIRFELDAAGAELVIASELPARQEVPV